MVGLRVVVPNVGVELGTVDGARVVAAKVGLALGETDTDGAAVVGVAVGDPGSRVGPNVGAPDGTAVKGHVSSVAATRHSPVHAPPTKHPEFASSLKRRGPPLIQRKVASVSGLMKFIFTPKSEDWSTKITKSPLPPWKQLSVRARKARKSIRICP
jgi:hypothetical protein